MAFLYIALLGLPVIAFILFAKSSLRFMKGNRDWLGRLAPNIWILAGTGCALVVAVGSLFHWNWLGYKQSVLISVFGSEWVLKTLGATPVSIVQFYFFIASLFLAITAAEKRPLSGFLGGVAVTTGLFLPALIALSFASRQNMFGPVGFLAAPLGAQGGLFILMASMIIGVVILLIGAAIGAAGRATLSRILVFIDAKIHK